MKALNSNLISEKNKPENFPIFLYTLHDYDGIGTDLNFAAYDADVTFSGKTYYKAPIAHEAVAENSSGQIDAVKVRVANVNRVMQGYLEDHNLRGKQVDIILVFANKLSNPSYQATDTFYVDSYTADENIVEFTLTTKFDILDVNIPGRKFLRNFCQWKFKSTECGYSGATTTCNKTKVACKALANFSRFGGFPSIPQQRTYVQ